MVQQDQGASKRNAAFLDIPKEDETPVGDTPVETPEGDTTPETPAVTPVVETPAVTEVTETLLAKHGLDGKYASEEEALKALKAQEVTISQHNMERQGWERRIDALERKREETPPTKINAERFEEDPQAALEDAGYVQQGDVAQMVAGGIQNAMDAKDANEFMTDKVRSRADGVAFEEVMDRISRQTPWIGTVPRTAAVKYLFNEARELMGETPIKKVEVKPAPGAGKKPNANTSGGGRSGAAKFTDGPLKGFTEAEIDAMTPEQMVAKGIIKYE